MLLEWGSIYYRHFMTWNNQAYSLLLSDKYQAVAELYEQLLESDPENITHYWYLGLAYLLQKKEEAAQTTWLIGMSQGDETEIAIWTKELIAVLELEAQRQVSINHDDLGWLIRLHIREIQPDFIDNLLALILLDIKLNYYKPERLEEWEIIEHLQNTPNHLVDGNLLMSVLRQILKFYPHHSLELARFCAHYLPDKSCLIPLLKSAAIEVAYTLKNPFYASEMMQICLEILPGNLEILNELYWFSFVGRLYTTTLKAAKEFSQLATTPLLKSFGEYKLIQVLLSSGAWDQAKALKQNYLNSLQEIISLKPNAIDSMMRDCLQGMTTPLLYLEDNPAHNRVLQNQFASLFYSYLPQWLPYTLPQRGINYEDLRPLKIGYIGHTLKRHSVGWLSRWLLKYHDRDQFKLFLYLVSQQEDDITKKWFRHNLDKVHNFPHIPPKIAQQIYEDEIDILVDLDSTTHSITCQVMALKPAAIQVTWLGSDASGIPSIDYFIADPYVLPENAQEYYREKIWRLPQTYLAVDGFEMAVPTLSRQKLNIPEDAIIYLSVQTGLKRHPDTISLQMKILKSVPNSYFLIKGTGQQTTIKELFCKIAQQEGVSLEQLRFLDSSPTEEIHRANLDIADVVLDTYPYNGATTTLEVLWAEIPIVTRVGQQFSARNTYTFMVNSGVEEGIAWTDEDYIKWGVRLGTDRELREKIRFSLRKAKSTAPVWNALQFTREMENAYQQMWFAKWHS